MFDENAVLVYLCLLFTIIHDCYGGDMCYDSWNGLRYCQYGCCPGGCCDGPVGLIVGLVIGGGVLLFVIILVICLCRRRSRTPGTVVNQAAAPGVVMQSQIITPGGVVTTTGVQPGIAYGQPNYHGYPQYGIATQYPTVYAAPPPSYDDVTKTGQGQISSPQDYTGGSTNYGFSGVESHGSVDGGGPGVSGGHDTSGVGGSSGNVD